MVILKHIIMNEEFADIQYSPFKKSTSMPHGLVKYNTMII